MKPRTPLLEALRDGLDTRNWRMVAASRKSLHVRIHHLRAAGYRIEAEPIEGTGTPAPPVVYRLRGAA